ncbi:hypothetical protein SEA_AIKOY__53 [Mycobacterium phage Aikoy]|nr:hypothetical protein SEA_AIKOY__53 [Mycobacterium phage Aikoy]
MLVGTGFWIGLNRAGLTLCDPLKVPYIPSCDAEPRPN